MNSADLNETKQEQFDLKSEVFKYLPFWYLFVIGVVISLVKATLYLRYQNNVYQSKTIIKLLDDTSSDFKMPTSGVNFFMRSKINIENEFWNIYIRSLSEFFIVFIVLQFHFLLCLTY
jgi:uncharacterized membrane protein SirB2